MEIKFSEEQYKSLLKMIYLGEWMVNSYQDQPNQEFFQLAQYIYSFTDKFNLQKLVEKDQEFNEYFPSAEMEESIQEFIDDYDNENFWDEIIEKLAWRDMVEDHGEAAIKEMSINDLNEKRLPYLTKYAKEFEENGIKNLTIK
ncbi:MAG: hypothetical protein MJB14_07800 [Spirochaetes bacterium]|nr:hypothetical protein [Spirochaetota bacterium]